MQQTLRLIPLVALLIATTEAGAQKPKGVNGKTACALLSADEIKGATGRSDVARRMDHMDADTDVSSNCQWWGAVDITIHLGSQTKVMFGRERDTYAKAPARLGYHIEPLSGLGDAAYYMSYSGKAEVRVMVGETELAVSLSGTLPPDAEAKKLAQSLAKAAVAKLK
jgi:hypothetical protein